MKVSAKFFRFLLLPTFLSACLSLLAAERPVDLVYPQLDTYNSRWFFFSSAARPFGMVSLSPDTKVDGAWSSGYVYTTENIKGFSHIHAWQMSGLSVMPVSFKDGQEDALFKDCSSDFSHDGETVEVGYHSVLLDRYDVQAELTSTVRSGFHRYTYGRPEDKHGILFNLNCLLGPCDTYDGDLVLVDSHTVSGHLKDKPTFRRPKPVSIHFRAELDAPVTGIVRDPETGNCLLVLESGRSQVMMKVGISYTSEENASLNLHRENPSWDFDAVVRESKEEWNSLLSRIEVEGGDIVARRRFYTDLWHSLIGRHIINDVDGAYPDNMGPEYRTGHLPLDADGRPQFNHFNTDAFWGAQWNLNILWGLVYPEIYREMACSLMQYCHDGGLVPRGPSGGNYTYVMTGSSATPFIVSAIQKGIVTEDLEEIYAAVRKNHMPGGIMERGRYEHDGALGGGLSYYLENGYVPYPIPDERVGHTDGAGLTLEYAYQDWCLAQLALKLGHKEDYRHFMSRSENYRHLFDSSTGWMRPKDIDGNWLEPFDPYELGCGFIESNAAQGSWYVPHDAKGLAKLLGGRRKAAAKLDACFKEAEKLGFTSGTSHEAENDPELRRIPINYGNEPSIQTAFLFTLFGRHRLSEFWSRKIVDRVFSGLAPDTGYNGDEDQGMMGGLSVLMKIGLFEVDGGTGADPAYQTGSPVFDRIVIHLDKKFHEGDTFTITTENNSPDNIVVKKMYLNGRRIKAGELHHSDLVCGGELKMVMK